MTFDVHRTTLLTSVYDFYGQDATYTPSGGSAKTVRVLWKRPDEIAGTFGSQLHHRQNFIQVRASEITSPGEGDTFAVDGTTYVVQGQPQRVGDAAAEWLMECYKQ